MTENREKLSIFSHFIIIKKNNPDFNMMWEIL